MKIISKKFECNRQLANKLNLKEKNLDDDKLTSVIGGVKGGSHNGGTLKVSFRPRCC